MYEVGQLVVYGMHGVCRIIELEEKKIDRKLVSYFVLEPLEQPGTRYYVPSQNEAALKKIRPLMDKESLLAILSAEDGADAWIADENRRKQYYRELIGSVDSAAMIRMVQALHRHKAALAESGRKFHLCDENFLRDAQRVLGAELSLVLQIPVSDVPAYMENVMQSK